MSGYVLHPEALIDLEELWEFIAEDNLDAADRVLAEIYEAIQNLVPFPYQGHRRTDLTSKPVRFISVRSYLLVYAPEEKPLLVLAIMHGNRSQRVMAAILRGRD